MSDLAQLRLAAHRIFQAALRAVDPASAVRNSLSVRAGVLNVLDETIPLPEAGVYCVAVGKAGATMALAVEEILGDRFIAGVLSAPSAAVSRWQYFAGGHPSPNEASLKAAQAAFRLLKLASYNHATVIFMVSGGGSAMLEWPIRRDITLDDLRSANKTLVNCGASISEINAVRQAFSAVKGGRLATHAPYARQVTLIVSDVPRGEEYYVASGPTWSPPIGAPNAVEVISRYELRERLPPSIVLAIESSSQEVPPPIRHHLFVLLDNSTAIVAAADDAAERGFATEIARDISDEPIDIGCQRLLTRLADMKRVSPRKKNLCLISGGEFACPVRGDGIGGRNLETALRLAIAAEQSEGIEHFVALCGGTDGIDGNSTFAGAIVDKTTIERARAMGLVAEDFLNRSDSASFCEALGDVITTGTTGTNVRDLRILLTTN